jgi:glycosyltransferase involved in cell wall biosynthesis
MMSGPTSYQKGQTEQTGLRQRAHVRLRIWQIAESYPPVYGGGAGLYVRDICRALADRGHEVRVLSTEQCDAEPYSVRTELDGSVEVSRVNLPYFRSTDPDGWQLGLRRWQRHERRVARLIEDALAEWTPDLVSYTTTRPLGEECLMALGRHGLPIIGFLHEAWLICPRVMLHRSPTGAPCSGPGPLKCTECMYSNYDGSHLRATPKMVWRVPRLGIYPAYRIWRRRSARRQLSGAIAYSEFMTEAHRPHIRGPVLNVPLGVNHSALPATQPARPRTPFRFGFMGGFQPNKGVWDLLDAATALRAEGLDFELHIWGPGQDGGADEIARRDLHDCVRLRGMYTEDEIWAVYGEIDVAVIATTVPEPYGRIPIEAAANGAPTIGARAGGIPESIRHDVNGLLYDLSDRDDLARQMRRVLEEPGLYQRLQRALSRPPDTRSRGAAVEDAYLRVLASSPPHQSGGRLANVHSNT